MEQKLERHKNLKNFFQPV